MAEPTRMFDDLFAQVNQVAQKSAFQSGGGGPVEIPGFESGAKYRAEAARHMNTTRDGLTSGYQARISSALSEAQRRAQENASKARNTFLEQRAAAPASPGGAPIPAPAGGAIPAFFPGAAGAYTPAMTWLRDYARNQWGLSNIGGYADRNVAGTNKKSDHGSYRALDFMVGNDRAKGDQIANYVINNHDKFGVKYVIWYDRIWSPGRGWRPYRHPSGNTSNPTLQHRDHPHVSFS